MDPSVKRRQLLAANTQARVGDAYLPKGKLDSSLKKNTAFIKKVKTGLTAETCAGVLKDIETLSLEKYLSEILVSIQESVLKVSKPEDLVACMTVLSKLHQRFPGKLIPQILSVIVNELVDLNDEEPISRPRNALRLVVEMNMVGLALTLEDCDVDMLTERAARLHKKYKSEPILMPVLKSVMLVDPKSGYSLRLVALVMKRYSYILDGPLGPGDEEGETTEVKEKSAEIAGTEEKEEPDSTLRDLLTVFTTKMFHVLKQQHNKVAHLTKRDHKIAIRTGRQSDKHTEAIEAENELEALMLTHVTTLCELLGLDVPKLEVSEEESEDEVVRPSSESANVWWEDTKERNFYKEIPTIEKILADPSIVGIPESEISALRDADKVVEFVLQLENVGTEQDVYRLVKIYVTQLPHNKATSNRLLRFFSAVPKVDNLRFLAKYLKITSELYPELIVELIETLDGRFRSQMYHGSINFRNLYFFIELIKFDLIPSHVVFHKIQKMTVNIAGTRNVDILLIFYERCGKFLLLEPNYLKTTKEMLKLLKEHSKSEKLTINEKLSLRNMFLIVNSFTETKPVEKVKIAERGPVEDFVIQLFRRMPSHGRSYNATFVSNIMKQVLSLPEAQSAVQHVFQTPEELPLDRLYNLTSVLGTIGTENPFVVHRICDTLVENVIRGLELNDYRKNTARTAQIKLLAALVNAMVLGIRCAFDLLFKIICFGHANNLPLPNSDVAIDQLDDYFRIHLVCTFFKSLDFTRVSKANLFKRGTKSVEGLLVFLQYYIFCKRHPLPKDVQFLVEDAFGAFNTRSPKPFERATDLNSAMIALRNYTNVKAEDSQTQETENLDDSDEFEGDVDDSDLSDNEGLSDSESELELSEEDRENGPDNSEVKVSDLLDSDSDDLEYASSLEDDEDYGLHSEKEKEYVPSALEAKQARLMDEEIRQLMNQPVSLSRPATFKVPAPSTFLNPDTTKSEGPMKFAFLTKKNQLRELLLPSNNQFAERIEREQAAQRANREKILNLINNMDS